MTQHDPFELPFTLDFGPLRIDFGRNGVFLKNGKRSYPHAGVFYNQKPGKDYWWPHYSPAPHRRKEELGKWTSEDAKALNERLEGIWLPSLASVFCPTALEGLDEDGWWAVNRTPELAYGLLRCFRKGRVFSIRRLEESYDELCALLLNAFVLPSSLTEPGNYNLIHSETLEGAFLQGFRPAPNEKVSWFFSTHEELQTVAMNTLPKVVPEFVAGMERALAAIGLG